MRYDFTVHFSDGSYVSGDGTDVETLTMLNALAKARNSGDHSAAIGLDGGRCRTVGDVRSIETLVEF